MKQLCPKPGIGTDVQEMSPFQENGIAGANQSLLK
jgi:hypothetical protein